ncbi:uroporphyrinogen-III C-methyltransferase [Cohnella lubricantis]|uniref:Uroporphyrinogen-III C-methyltransferase n=1 Tax=Cohnella lubricantis TaxID=2163172 RepID=A0A841TA74_9BACL|nr:uroporphyrinogen-III C-methyltransferase [Cohnella lubricantis]MBB6676925.1 uroporphyrinogen-III C-methyltransferase [Cohnella lubricantis]MBP2118329.1 uroporphyrin-III C-methyltransferase [Cohnella lubricantis]
MSAGFASIVGAGPGDPELITLKALKRIRAADVILYDRLVNEELLEYARPDAERIYCGKAPGRHSMPQWQINELLVALVRQGKTAVRLKGGDPFVFGRGGEEALALAEAWLPYEIVPGITSAIGSAASSGIPLTHRGVAGSFAIVTGSLCHDNEKPPRWDLLAHSVDTLVVYMGVSRLGEIRAELLRHGKPESTPVALIERGTTAEERVVAGTLADIHKLAEAMKLENPALIVVGEAVSVRESLLRLEAEARLRIG